jgi:uncharacterized delta-60 repeat protein
MIFMFLVRLLAFLRNAAPSLFAVLIAASLLSFPFDSFSQSYAIDPSFNPQDVGYGKGDGPGEQFIYSIAEQADQKILIGGSLITYNGEAVLGIVRLQKDGEIDKSFTATVEGTVFVIKVLSDGKILVGGAFTRVNGIAKNGLVRLLTDGSIDPSFNNTGISSDGQIRAISILDNGKVFVAGSFAQINDTAKNDIAKLLEDGSLDPGFDAGAGTTDVVHNISILNDQMFITGSFSSFNGVTRMRVARLNADGSVDTGYNPGIALAQFSFIRVTTSIVQPDGQLIIGGWVRLANEGSHRNIYRFKADGSVDETFIPIVNEDVRALALAPNGSILVGGVFKDFEGTERDGIIRLNADGSKDAAGFNSGKGAEYVLSMCIQQDGNVLISGVFASYNDTVRNRFARIDSAGNLLSFNLPGYGTNFGVTKIYPTGNNKMFAIGAFTAYNRAVVGHLVKLNADGTIDNSFNPGQGASSEVSAIKEQQDGKLIIGGHFTHFNGLERRQLIRLNPNGSLDASFQPEGIIFGGVENLLIQPDGKIIVLGIITINDINQTVVRFNNDGTLDPTFTPVTTSVSPDYIELQNDGKIIVAGSFSSVNGVPNSNIIRLNANGTLDNSFSNAFILPEGWISSMTRSSSGNLLISHTAWVGNDRVEKLTRLNPDGTVDTGFDVVDNTVVISMVIQASGGMICVGSHKEKSLFRLNNDGSLDESFNPLDYYCYMTAITQVGDKLIVGGEFTHINGLGKNRIAAFAPKPIPVISLTGPTQGKHQDLLSYSFESNLDTHVTWTVIDSLESTKGTASFDTVSQKLTLGNVGKVKLTARADETSLTSAATAEVIIEIKKGLPQITFNDSTISYGDYFRLRATAYQGVDFIYTVLSDVSNTAQIEITDGDSVSVTKSGKVKINASAIATENSLTANKTMFLTIEKADQVISFPEIQNKINTADPFTIAVISSSNQPIDITVSSGPATVTGNMVTLTEVVGTVVIQATQEGTDNYNEAVPVTRTFEVTKDPILSVESGLFSSIDVWPIPAQKQLQINSQRKLITAVRLTDTMGKTVVHTKPLVFEITLEIGTMSEGLYFLIISTLDGDLTKRIAIKR